MTPQGDPPFDLGRIDDLAVTVGFGPAPDAPADEVYLLTARPELAQGERWDDRPYVDALEDLLKDSEAPHTLQVTRTHTSWGTRSATVSIALRIGIEPGELREGVAAAVRNALGRMLETAGGREPPAVPHDAAVEQARRLTALAWSDVEQGSLTITDEEHHHSTGVWTIGLSDARHDRFQVEVGLISGDPATGRISRSSAAEIVDSVGVEGP